MNGEWWKRENKIYFASWTAKFVLIQKYGLKTLAALTWDYSPLKQLIIWVWQFMSTGTSVLLITVMIR